MRADTRSSANRSSAVELVAFAWCSSQSSSASGRGDLQRISHEKLPWPESSHQRVQRAMDMTTNVAHCSSSAVSTYTRSSAKKMDELCVITRNQMSCHIVL